MLRHLAARDTRLSRTLRQPGRARPPGDLVAEWKTDTGRTCARVFKHGDSYVIHWDAIGELSVTPTTGDVDLQSDPALARDDIDGIFQRVIQPALLPAFGVQVLHASAVDTPAGAVVFAGRGHAGKSTLAFAVGQAVGCRQLADDAVAWLSDEGALPRIQPLAFRSELRRPSAAHFHSPPASATRPAHDPVPMRLIALLRQDATLDTAVVAARLQARDAFTAVLTHARDFDPTDRTMRATMVGAYLTLVERVPVYQLTYRPDFTALPALTARVLALAESAP